MTTSRRAGVIAFVVAVMLWATLTPLLAYTASLACFGLAHVVVELRYVDARFGRRLPRSLWMSSALLIGGVVVLRALRLGSVVVDRDVSLAVSLELALVALLIGMGATLALRHRVVGAVGFVAAVIVGIGVVVAPIEMLLTLAVLHNLTPLGFVVERAAPGERWRTFGVGAAIFIGVPTLVASGLPATLLDQLVDVNVRFFSARPIGEHLGVYLWPVLVDDARAVSLFSAAVCAQLLHYGAVLGWLPRTLDGQDRPALPWPSWPVLIAGLVIVGGGLAIHFAVDFVGARAVYSLPAAIHAWLELPLLLVAFCAWSTSSSTPTTSV
jgi:hypothetical protein